MGGFLRAGQEPVDAESFHRYGGSYEIVIAIACEETPLAFGPEPKRDSIESGELMEERGARAALSIV